MINSNFIIMTGYGMFKDEWSSQPRFLETGPLLSGVRQYPALYAIYANMIRDGLIGPILYPTSWYETIDHPVQELLRIELR